MSEEMILLPNIPDVANLSLADPSLVNFYTDLEHRTYWLNDEINNYTFDLVQYIIKWNREDKDIPVEQRKPIRIIIDCMGGYLSVSETVANIIKMSKTPVYGIALGYVASGATLIYLSCHKKLALPNTCFILHKGSCNDIGGTFDEVQAFMKDYEKQMEVMMKFYQEHTKYTAEEIELRIKTDWYVRLPEASNRGMVDEVITDIDVFC